MVKMKDKYPCGICKKETTTSKDFKKHLFHSHSDIEVRTKYNKTLE
jgi:hypothetical protein